MLLLLCLCVWIVGIDEAGSSDEEDEEYPSTVRLEESLYCVSSSAKP